MSEGAATPAPPPRSAAAFGALLASMVAYKLLAACVVPVPLAMLPWLPCGDVALAAGLAWLVAIAPRAARRWLVGMVVVGVTGWHALAMLSVQALGMPFLPSMLAGCDAAMQDSVAPYLTWANGGRVAFLLAMAAIGWRVGRARTLARTWWLLAAVAAALLAMVGPAPVHACHRNPVLAFGRQLLPRAPLLPRVSGEPTVLANAAAAPTDARSGCAQGRSVVVVVLESAATRFVASAAGQPSAMPFLRQLAATGLDCPQAYAVYPESIEGQVPILCGLPPMPDADPSDYAEHGRSALPQRLRPHGYRSGLFHAGRFRFLGMQHVLDPMQFDELADAGTIGGERESSFGIDEEATVDALLAFVARQPATQRVLACWLPIAGHHPYSSPPGGSFPSTTQLGCYQNALQYADRSLARLWTGLCALRPPEHWLLCIVGDHGQAFGEHDGNFGHSFELYEENLRVPLVFVAPGTTLGGACIDTPCTHLDVVPTLLDLLGLPVDASLLRQRTGGNPVAVHAFTDWGELQVMRREADWKLIHEPAMGRDRLFDLASDPQEARDVALQHAERVVRMRQQSLAFLSATRGSTRH